MTAASLEEPAEHTVTTRPVAGPGGSYSGGTWWGPTTQHIARCSCGWQRVSVTAAHLALLVAGHDAEMHRGEPPPGPEADLDCGSPTGPASAQTLPSERLARGAG